MILSLLPLNFNLVSAAENEEIIWYNGFNSFKTNAAVNDIVDKGIIKDSGKRNKFLSFSVGDRKKQINWDGEIPQKTFSMSMDICLSKKIKQFQPFVLLDSSGNQYILYNSNFSGAALYDGKPINSINKYGEWINIRCTINPITGRYNIYVDNRSITGNYILPVDAEKITGVSSVFSGDSDTASIMVDNMCISIGDNKTKNYPNEAYNEEVCKEEQIDTPQKSSVNEGVWFYEDFNNHYISVDDIMNYNGNNRFNRMVESGLKGDSTMQIKKDNSGNEYLEFIRKREDPFFFVQRKISEKKVFLEINLGNESVVGGEVTLFMVKASNNIFIHPLKINSNRELITQDGYVVGKLGKTGFTEITCELNMDSSTYSIYIDRELALKDEPFSNAGFDEFLQWRVYVWNKGGETKLLIDKIAVYTSDSFEHITDEMRNPQIKYRFADDSVAIEQAGDKTVAFNAYSNTVLINGEKAEIKNKPIMDTDGICFIPSELIEKGFDAKLGIRDAKLTVNDISVKSKLVGNEWYAEVSDLAENCLKLNYFVDNEGDEQGFGIIGERDFGDFKENPHNFREISDYLIFSRPKKEQILKDFKNVGEQTHPRLLVNKNQMNTLLKQSKTDSWKNSAAQRLISFADKRVSAADFTLTKYDGTRLNFSELYLGTIAMSFAYLYNKDEKYKNRIWHDFERIGAMKDWNPDHFLDTSVATQSMAIAYDWLYDYWTDDQREKMETWIVEKSLNFGLQAAFSNWFYSVTWLYPILDNDERLGNWPIVCQAGLVMGALAVMDKYPQKSSQIIETAMRNLEYSIVSYAPDGAWNEGISYWTLAGDALVGLLSSLESSLGTDYNYSDYEPLKKTSEFLLAMTGPTDNFNFGDAPAGFTGTYIMSWFSSKYNNASLGRARIGEIEKKHNEYEFMDLAYLPYNVDTDVKIDLDRQMYYRGVEVGMMRSGWDSFLDTYVGFRGGWNKSPHGHYDMGTFIFDSMGERWICQLGQDNYNSPEYGNSTNDEEKAYRMRTEGNNCYVINPSKKTGQLKTANENRLVRMQSNETDAYAIVDITAAYCDVAESALRGFWLTDNKNSLIVRDEIKFGDNESSNVFYSFMHTTANVTVDGNTAILTKNGKKMKYEFISNQPLELSVMNAQQLPTSPSIETGTQYGQYSNDGYQKLTLSGNVSGTVNITVKISPVLQSGEYSEIKDLPLNRWNLHTEDVLYKNDYSDSDDLDFDKKSAGRYNVKYAGSICDYYAGKCFRITLDKDRISDNNWGNYRFCNILSNVAETKNSLDENEKLVFEYSVMLEDKDKVGFVIQPLNLWMTNFMADGTICTTTNEGFDKKWNAVGVWSPGEWVNISVVLYKDRMFDMYINGEKVVENKKMYQYNEQNIIFNYATPYQGWEHLDKITNVYVDNVFIGKYGAKDYYVPQSPSLTGNIYNNILFYDANQEKTYGELKKELSVNSTSEIVFINKKKGLVSDCEPVCEDSLVYELSANSIFSHEMCGIKNSISISNCIATGKYISNMNFDDISAVYNDDIIFRLNEPDSGDMTENWCKFEKANLCKLYPDVNWDGILSAEIKGVGKGTIKIKKDTDKSYLEFNSDRCNEYVRFGNDNRIADKRYLAICGEFFYDGGIGTQESGIAVSLTGIKTSDDLLKNVVFIRESDNQLIAMNGDEEVELGCFVNDTTSFKVTLFADMKENVYNLYVNDNKKAEGLKLSLRGIFQYAQIYMNSAVNRNLRVYNYRVFNSDEMLDCFPAISVDSGEDIKIPVKKLHAVCWNNSPDANIKMITSLYSHQNTLVNCSIYNLKKGEIDFIDKADKVICNLDESIGALQCFIWDFEKMKPLAPKSQWQENSVSAYQQ